MKSLRLNSLLSCILLLLICGCNEINPEGEKEVRAFVKQWNDSHSQLKASYLKGYYMDVVTYYGQERTKTQVQQDKLLLFENFPDYKQRVDENDMVITEEGGSYLATFTKQVYYNGREAEYTCFLSLINKNHKFKILREGVDQNSEGLDAPIFPYNRENNPTITKNKRLYGDFNGDGLSDYAYVNSPKLELTSLGERKDGAIPKCKGECNSKIRFSDDDLEDILVKGAYQSQIENLKDLNDDGADEIGFWDIKPSKKSLYIFDANNSKLLCEPVVINTNMHRSLNLIDVFKKTGPKKITVTHSALVNGDWVLKSKVIQLD